MIPKLDDFTRKPRRFGSYDNPGPRAFQNKHDWYDTNAYQNESVSEQSEMSDNDAMKQLMNPQSDGTDQPWDYGGNMGDM